MNSDGQAVSENGEDDPRKCPDCGGNHDPAEREEKAVQRGRKALKNARKKFGGTVNDADQLGDHGMDPSRINDIVSNPSAVFYDMNKQVLKFFQEGDLVVVDKQNMSEGITAFGRSDKDGDAVTKESQTTGKYQCRAFRIE